jgi:hypothetical protein
MTQFRGLNGGIPSTIVFGQRVREALHHPFDSGCLGVHVARLLGSASIQGLDIIFQANQEVICVPFLRPCRQFLGKMRRMGYRNRIMIDAT